MSVFQRHEDRNDSKVAKTGSGHFL